MEGIILSTPPVERVPKVESYQKTKSCNVEVILVTKGGFSPRCKGITTLVKSIGVK